MAIIKIKRAPDKAIDKGRPVSSLLRTQLEHMQHAEFRLPANQQTNIYTNAIRTEGEAADYIRKVTERLHESHGVAPSGVSEHKVRPGKIPQIAASAATVRSKASGKSATAGKKASKKKRS